MLFRSWQLGDPPTVPKPAALAWRVTETKALGDATWPCALHAGGEVDLTCQAENPVVAVSPLLSPPAGSDGPLHLKFQSAGTWPLLAQGTLARVQVKGDGEAAWVTVADVQPSAGWQTIDVSLTAPTPLQVRFAFGGECNPAFTGWFVQSVVVYQDVCAGKSSGCAAGALCTLTDDGKPACKCKVGFEGDGKTCVDIDECANGTAGCDEIGRAHV